MEGIFIGVLCLSGCLTFSTCLLHQYHFMSNAKTWTEAQSYCREKYTDLATIENTEEMKKLNDTVSAAGNSSEVWIGLYSHIDWKWSDGFNQSGAEYRNWYPSQPNNDLANELCVVMSASGKWHDYGCHTQFQSVCFNGTLEDSDFVPVNTAKTWSEAQRHCREHYTDLATVRNDTDNNKIHTLIPSFAWIGLYRDPQIYWSDGSNYSFSSWYQGDHPLGSMKVVCGVADLEKGGNWRLISCEERKPFVCYSITTVKTLVKMRVKLEDSSLDLNDPAVKEQILKELQDRLKENGLSGVTLKWKEQADGKVFHKEEKGSDKKKKTEL
ncbi:aggrecan core protein [Pleuronectes platessa]|uniref:aggrecan core protein n=1 Tax=Pleuronectes platessa TaxID=8262 RepID=UPI00232A5270|nr:aggrecan core protein [Pleuronectes platessa]